MHYFSIHLLWEGNRFTFRLTIFVVKCRFFPFLCATLWEFKNILYIPEIVCFFTFQYIPCSTVLFNFGIIFYFRLFENVCFAVETCNTFFFLSFLLVYAIYCFLSHSWNSSMYPYISSSWLLALSVCQTLNKIIVLCTFQHRLLPYCWVLP